MREKGLFRYICQAIQRLCLFRPQSDELELGKVSLMEINQSSHDCNPPPRGWRNVLAPSDGCTVL